MKVTVAGNIPTLVPAEEDPNIGAVTRSLVELEQPGAEALWNTYVTEMEECAAEIMWDDSRIQEEN